jgi:TDG/mug DNA glycosylase family protein
VRLRGLAPVSGRRVHTLILGSMPGVASLEVQEYYGHPRNAFWDVAAELGISRALPYRGRCARLKHLGFALWDVIGECERSGSLDQAIRNASVNDLNTFASEHPRLTRIWFNGQTAAKTFERKLGPKFRASFPAVGLRTFPSTSPAHTDKTKHEHWRAALREAALEAHAGQAPPDLLARRFGA